MAGIQALVEQNVAGSCLMRASGTELVYRLPMNQTAAFSDLLDVLEASSGKLGVGHYGLSMPTLEEVFLRCTLDVEAREGATARESVAEPVSAAARDDVPPPPAPGTPTIAEGEMVNIELTSVDLASVHDSVSSPLAEIDLDSETGESVGGSAEPTPVKAAAGKQLPGSASAKLAGLRRPVPTADGGDGGAKRGVRRHWALQHLVALGEMLQKRFLIASRDLKGMFFTLLLPICTVAFIMLILTVNIDPTSPTLILSMGEISTAAPPIAASLAPPALLAACAAKNATGSCPLRFRSVPGIDSFDLSKALLSDRAGDVPAQYAALIFDDPVVRGIPSVVSRTAAENGVDISKLFADSAASFLGIGGIGAGSAAAAAAAAAFGGQTGMSTQDIITLILSSEARVLRDSAARLGRPPVLLMHNASSYHALPALISDLHEVRFDKLFIKC